jgi:twitching motility two-component system response regulator PilH
MNLNRILVVEDSPTNMRFLVDALKHNGYQDIITASDGEEAITKAVSEKPHLMILDVILPKKNGFQVCRALRNIPEMADMKILMLTSKDQDSDRFWGLKQGADLFMTKPYETNELIANIVKMMKV